MATTPTGKMVTNTLGNPSISLVIKLIMRGAKNSNV